MNWLFGDIGKKLKGWAMCAFIIEALASIITGWVLMYEEDVLYILIIPVGIFAALSSAWLLYGFGELIDQTSINRENTNKILSLLNKEMDTELPKYSNPNPCSRSNASSGTADLIQENATHKWRCEICGKMRTKTPCEYCGKE